VPGANAMMNADDVAEIPLAEDDVAVSQFEIPLPAITAFFQRARAAGATTILNPAPAIECGAELLDLVDILVLNESELGFLAGKEFSGNSDPARLVEAARSLSTGDKIVCVTLGERGALALIDGKPLPIPGRKVQAVDTTGAGDCFVGAFAAQLASGNTIPYALGYANAAASICVQRMGAGPSMPTATEVNALLSASRPGERR
jgi:ribokinase